MYSTKTYGELLRTIATSGYRFVDFASLDIDSAERQVVLRHDVDGTLHMAAEIAEIDAAHGLRATFFFLLRSHVYNLFSPWTVQVLEKVSRLGHDVALHCRLPVEASAATADLVALVQDELDSARRAFASMSPLFSWHAVPSDFFTRWRALEVPGLVNAYSDRFFAKAKFVSDSNGRYTPEELESLFRSRVHAKVQLLLHPMIWGCGGRTMMEVWSNVWKGIIREAERDLKGNRVYGDRLPGGVSATTIDQFASSFLSDARRCGA